VLAVDVDDIADEDDRLTVGAGLGVTGLWSFGGQASHAEIVGEVAAGQGRAAANRISSSHGRQRIG
jgi:hypothetical protein